MTRTPTNWLCEEGESLHPPISKTAKSTGETLRDQLVYPKRGAGGESDTPTNWS